MKKKTIVLLSLITVVFISALSLLVFNVLNVDSKAGWKNRPENIWKTATVRNFGIDISHYQGKIDWADFTKSAHDIKYIFIRASMGSNGEDKRFKENWKNSKQQNYLRGAYHYYRPNENSVKQFHNFSKRVVLEPGDLPPILDIEEMSVYGEENLIAGILNWLRLVEEHYGVTPIVYTGASFYKSYLKGRVDKYPLWIAAYSSPSRIRQIEWKFHQFSDRIKIRGIREPVDGNAFNGEIKELLELCKPGFDFGMLSRNLDLKN